MGVLAQPFFQAGGVAFAGFAQEPSHSLLKQVVQRIRGRLEKDSGNGICVIELSGPDKSHCADNADTALPDCLPVAGQFVEQCPVFVHKPFTEKGIAAQIHEVPVIDVLKVSEIEVNAVFSPLRVPLRPSENLDQGQESRQPDLMVLARNAFFQFCIVSVAPACPDHFTCHGNLYSQKLVTFSVLPGAAFEKSRQSGN